MKMLRLLALLLLLPGLAFGASTSTPPGITQLNGAGTAGPGGGTQNLLLQNHLFNWDAARVPHLRWAMSQMNAGIRDVRLMDLGDSTTVGLGANTGLNGLVGAQPLNVTSQLTTILRSAGFPTKSQSVTFSNVVGGGVGYGDYDPRITVDANWTLSGQNTVAGLLYIGTAGAVMTFKPTQQFDTFDIFYLNQPGGGFTVATEAGTVLTVTGAGFAFQKSTVSVPRGIHTLTITSGGANANIGPIIPSDTTQKGIEIINAGIIGATTATYNNALHPWSPITSTALTTWGIDAVVIELTINDSNNGVALSTYITNLTTIITAYRTAGFDVILASGSPYNGNVGATPVPYVQALYALALQFNIPLIDMNARYVSFAYTNPIIPYFNGLHFTQFGYYDKAQAYAAAEAQFLGSTLGGNGSGAEQTISFQPGLLTAVTNTKGVFGKFVKASTVDNIIASAINFTCVGNPTITLYECGTDANCATSPVSIGTATVTAAGVAVTGTVSAPAITAGDFVAWAISAGTCTSLDISANAQVHAN